MMRRIVLTGGPCAGKTRCLESVVREFSGRVLGVDEIATKTFLAMGPPPEGHADWNAAFAVHPPWRREFQARILAAQWESELRSEAEAQQKGIPLLVCDRGLLDGSAYWPEGLSDFLDQFQLDVQDCHRRYERIIHLESTAMVPGAWYSGAENATRRESKDEAVEREKRTWSAWEGHPNRTLVRFSESFETKIRATLDEVARILETI